MDAIVMKALRRDPMERYASVAELSKDLARFLDSRPVRARRGHALYCIGSLLHRHRVGLGIAAMLMAVTIAFGFELAVQLHRVEVERDKAREIAGFLQDLLEHADSAHAGMRQALDRGVAILSSRTDIAPEVRVSLLLSMAKSYNALGLGAPAIRLLERARSLQLTYDATRLERSEVVAALGRAYSILLDAPSSAAADDGTAMPLTRVPDRQGRATASAGVHRIYHDPDAFDMALDEMQLSAGMALSDTRSGNCGRRAWTLPKFAADMRMQSGAALAAAGCFAAPLPVAMHCAVSCR
jgi:serine/threonine-protein kinase